MSLVPAAIAVSAMYKRERDRERESRMQPPLPAAIAVQETMPAARKDGNTSLLN
jgi:hypothetical protein